MNSWFVECDRGEEGKMREESQEGKKGREEVW